METDSTIVLFKTSLDYFIFIFLGSWLKLFLPENIVISGFSLADDNSYIMMALAISGE